MFLAYASRFGQALIDRRFYLPEAWSADGRDSRLRRMLERRGKPYVLAVRSNHCLRFWNQDGLRQTSPEELCDELEGGSWATHPAGEGSKGLRLYDWARIALPSACDPAFERWLLIRRSRKEPDKRAYYLVFAPAGATLAELAVSSDIQNWALLHFWCRPR